MNDTIFFSLYNLSHKSLFFDNLIIFFAQYFPYLVIFLAVCFLLFHHEVFSKKESSNALQKKLKEIFYVFFSVIAAWLVSLVLKIILKIPRPFIEFNNVLPLLRPTDYSFPSGHSAFFMATAVAIFLCHKKAGYFFILSALLIGIARIIAGVHYPVDILGGFIFGGILSYLILKLFKKI
jgi:undecaprenyl-diphosphatase